MPSFWREISDVVVNHTVGRRFELLQTDLGEAYELLDKLEARMTSAESDVAALNALYTELDQWSNEVASELDALRQHAETGNVSAADVAARLTPIVNRLKAAGQDGSVTGSTTDPTTTTDPTNSPTADSPAVNPAPDAPTDVPTNDPTVNPVDVPADSQAGSSANDAEAQGTVGTPAVTEPASTTPAEAPAQTTDSSSTTSTAPVTDPPNTNDFREEF